MEPKTRHADDSDRLRVADAPFGAGNTSLDFSGGLAGVLTETAERSAAAGWIATTVMGPEPANADEGGAVAASSVAARGRPARLAPPRGPAVVNRDDLRGHWQAVRAARRDELAATHASRRLERHRVEVALERGRARTVAPAAPAVSNALRVHVHSLLRAIDDLVPVHSLEALELADAWDVHTALVRARAADPGIDIEAAEARVSAARAALALSSGGLTAEVRAEIDRRHRTVVDAEAAMFEAKRKARPSAVAHLEAAVIAEKLALADVGLDSYAGFLFAIAGGETAVDTDARRAAQQELAAATAELDGARGRDRPSDAEFHARGVELRARAERLLGRVIVDGDPPAELRALRIEAPARAEQVRLLTDVLQGAGIAVHDDPVASARRLLASKPSGSDERSGESAASGELDSLERQQAQDERSLADLEGEIARLDAVHESEIGGIAPVDLALIMDSLLDAYRARGGRMPLVFDGAFDGIAPDARQAALLVLARTTDVQSIVVTDDLRVMKSVAQAGGTIVLWTEPAPPERGNAGLQSSQHSQHSRSSEA